MASFSKERVRMTNLNSGKKALLAKKPLDYRVAYVSSKSTQG